MMNLHYIRIKHTIHANQTTFLRICKSMCLYVCVSVIVCVSVSVRVCEVSRASDWMRTIIWHVPF